MAIDPATQLCAHDPNPNTGAMQRRNRHNQKQPFQCLGRFELIGLDLKATALIVQEALFNGIITNDKFCCTRWATLPLSWWRRPLRLRS